MNHLTALIQAEVVFARTAFVALPAIIVVEHREIGVPLAAFRPRRILSCNVQGLGKASEVDRIVAIRDALATATCYTEFLMDQLSYRYTTNPRKHTKPVLESYKSPRWWLHRNKLDRS